ADGLAGLALAGWALPAAPFAVPFDAGAAGAGLGGGPGTNLPIESPRSAASSPTEWATRSWLYLGTEALICIRPSALAASARTSGFESVSARSFIAGLAISAYLERLGAKPCRNAERASNARI